MNTSILFYYFLLHHNLIVSEQKLNRIIKLKYLVQTINRTKLSVSFNIMVSFFKTDISIIPPRVLIMSLNRFKIIKIFNPNFVLMLLILLFIIYTIAMFFSLPAACSRVQSLISMSQFWYEY